jgi:hypothetical protein
MENYWILKQVVHIITNEFKRVNRLLHLQAAFLLHGMLNWLSLIIWVTLLQPTPWSSVLREKLIAAHVVEKGKFSCSQQPARHRPQVWGRSKESILVRASVGHIVTYWSVRRVASRRPTPKVVHHPLSALSDCLFNIFAAISISGGRLLHPQPDNTPCRSDRGQLTQTFHSRTQTS